MLPKKNTSNRSSCVESRSNCRSKMIVHVGDAHNIAVDAADVLNTFEGDLVTAPHAVLWSQASRYDVSSSLQPTVLIAQKLLSSITKVPHLKRSCRRTKMLGTARRLGEVAPHDEKIR